MVGSEGHPSPDDRACARMSLDLAIVLEGHRGRPSARPGRRDGCLPSCELGSEARDGRQGGRDDARAASGGIVKTPSVSERIARDPAGVENLSLD